MDENGDFSKLRPKTRAVRGGTRRTGFEETSEAMFLTSGFAYPSAESAERRFKNEEGGYVYSRFGNPTVEMFENRLALIEGAARCRATASGLAAVTAAMLALTRAGDHVVAARAMFGGCRYIIEELLPRFGVSCTLIDGRDLDAWAHAARPETKVFFLETPSNPTLELIDIAAVAAIARRAGARLVVDNVFATPILQAPLTLGADIVIYSATKHIDGQGRCLGGAILSNDIDWIEKTLWPLLRNTGPSLSPFNAWVLLKSLETLALRVETATAHAAHVASGLKAITGISRVIYPFADDFPQRELARRQMKAGGTLVTFEVAGGKDAAFRFANALKIIDISNNLGDAKSLITHPVTTTHQRLSPEARAELGITPGMLRLSVGLEDPEDLLDDLRRAAAKASRS